MTTQSFLPASPLPLGELYPFLLCDLDGTVYNGNHAIDSAITVLQQQSYNTVYYVTNNGSRTPDQVCAKLSNFGLDTTPFHIVTSAQGVAKLAKNYLSAEDSIYVLGANSLTQALSEEGFSQLITVNQINSLDDSAEKALLIKKIHSCKAVVQSMNPNTSWQNLADAAIAIQHGALWFTSNTDKTLPDHQGFLPGNGAFVQALAFAVAPITPFNAGKPSSEMLAIAINKAQLNYPANFPSYSNPNFSSLFLMIGDRLDTDIGSGINAGVSTLCVLTGVSSLTTILQSPAELTPTYVAPDFSALHRPALESYIEHKPHWQVYWERETNTLFYDNNSEDPLWNGVLTLLHVAKTIPAEYKATVQLQPLHTHTPSLQSLFPH